MSVTVTSVPASGATPNDARNTWNADVQALATEVNAHEALTNTAHGGILTYSGQAFKQAVRASTTGALPSNTYSSGVLTATANGALPSQDGVSLNLGDRLLVTGEGSGTSIKNLIYTITSLGGTTSTWSMTVAPDSTNGNLVTQQRVAIAEGSTLKNQILYVSTSGAITVGTTPVTWGVPTTGPSVVGTADTMWQTHIEGLTLTWDSATTLGIETGCAWVPAANKVVDVPTRLTITGIAPGINTKQYVYLVYNVSTGAVSGEAVTTAPVFYKGGARQKTGDTTRRYLGMILGNAAGTGMYAARWHASGLVTYQENLFLGTVFQVLADGRATTETVVSCSGVAPVSSRLAVMSLHAWDSGKYLVIGNSGDDYSLTANSFDNSATRAQWQQYGAASGNGWDAWIDLDSAQAFSYRWSSGPTSGNGLYASVRGYQEVR